MLVAFVVNEHAGNGRGHTIWRKIEKKIAFPHVVYKTVYPKHAIEIIKQLDEELNEQCLIIAVGGDGTLNEVVAGAAGSRKLIISAIKAGSGNDFARGYKVFSDVDDLNVYVKRHGRADFDNKLEASSGVEMDVGQVSSDYAEGHFVNNAGFGYDALVATSVNRSSVKKFLNKFGLGRLAYVMLTLQLLFTFKRFNAKVVIDSNELQFKKVWFIAVCNQPYFGGGMKISPYSITNDGCFEVVVVQHISPIKLMALFLSVFIGKHEHINGISFHKAKHVQLTFDTSLVSHVDGDLYANIEAGKAVDIRVADESWMLVK